MDIITKNDSSHNESTTIKKEISICNKDFWIIVRYPESDPGCEYEILGQGDILWNGVLEKNCKITIIKYGNVKSEGIVVTVSDDLNWLERNFHGIVEDYDKEYEEAQYAKKRRKLFKNRQACQHIIKVADKSTQTETTDKDYFELKSELDQLRNKYNFICSLISDVKMDLTDTLGRIEIVDHENRNNRKSSTRSMESSPTSNSESKNVLKSMENHQQENATKMVQIGQGGTQIPRHIYNSIKWTSYSTATRKLLMTIFPRNILATHSLTGKPSPAFITSNKQVKMKLDQTKINDVIEIVTKKCFVTENLVRNAITTKCADENKMHKKKLKRQNENTENNNK